MQAPQLIIFDFDGTLADSFSWLTAVINQVADRHGFKRVGQSEVEVLRQYDHRQLIRHLAVPSWRVPWIASDIRRRMRADIAQIERFDGVDALFDQLSKDGISIAVVTSNSESNVRQVLGPDNAARVRHYGCGASLFGKAKKFRQVVRRSGVPRERVLCVGDEVRDIQAARTEGLSAGAVGWGFANPELLMAHSPDAFFPTLDALRQHLARAQGPSHRIAKPAG